jgi:hypothetical protein
MDNLIKRYGKKYTFKINDNNKLRAFEGYILDEQKRANIERSRKQTLDLSLHSSSVYPKSIRYCGRAALRGKLGFHRVYTNREVIDLLCRHGISKYFDYKTEVKVDSNYLPFYPFTLLLRSLFYNP